jgi:AMMECR1 domain-containing protein
VTLASASRGFRKVAVQPGESKTHNRQPANAGNGRALPSFARTLLGARPLIQLSASTPACYNPGADGSLDETGPPELPEARSGRFCPAARSNRLARRAKSSGIVTLRNPDGSLRGCIGSVRAMEPDVAAETARSAVLAATRDPRFDRVRLEELDALQIDVSVLLPEEPIRDYRDLDPSRYGVIVRDGNGRQGLLLPDVPGIDDVSTQVDVARKKAGVAESASVVISRFEVRKFKLRQRIPAR